MTSPLPEEILKMQGSYCGLHDEEWGFVKRVGRRGCMVVALCWTLWLSMLGSLTPGKGEEIPVVAYIGNAEPQILGIQVLDESAKPTNSIDPGSGFFLDILVRDNNTLADVARIRAILYSPSSSPGGANSEQDHYTFRWDSSGFANEGGVGSITVPQCSVPSDRTVAQGTWRFALKLSKNARQSAGWTILVRVEDEANLTQSSRALEVTSFVSLTIDASQITFSGSPGQVVAANQNPILVNYASNHIVNLACSCTQFIGVLDSHFVIDPSSFSVDDDPVHSQAQETGQAEVTLSTQRLDILVGLPIGTGSRNLYVFVSIPEPFLDQDYRGTMNFELSS